MIEKQIIVDIIDRVEIQYRVQEQNSEEEQNIIWGTKQSTGIKQRGAKRNSQNGVKKLKGMEKNIGKELKRRHN